MAAAARIELDQESRRTLMHRMFNLVWPYRWYLIPAFFAMLLSAGTSGAIAYLVQPILDKVFIEQDTAMLHTMPLMVLGAFLLRGAAYFVQSYYMEKVGLSVVRSLQVRLYNHLLEMDVGFFLSHTTGSLISRVTYDTNLLKSATSQVVANLLREGMTVVILLGVLFYRDWELALVAILGLPVAGYLVYSFGRKMRKLGAVRQELMGGMTSHLEETMSGLRIVKAFCMESYERSMFRRLSKQVNNNQLRSAFVRSITNPTMDLVAGLAVSGVILYGGQSVIQGQTTTGTFFSFITALLMAYDPVKKLTGLNNQLQESLSAASRIFAMVDTQPAIRDAGDAVTLPPFSQAIRFEGVTFAYAPDLPPVIKNLTLEVKRGERVALVGKSGSGKTTLANLTPRFFDVTEGRILVDGLDLRQVTLKSLRGQIAVVTQEVILFNDTVRNNIAYGGRDRSHEEIRAAAAAANALEFIEALPEGFDTVVGDRGVKLSGGQRQRLSIARSLLKNAPILILDEATSSLDSESELAVQEALEKLMENRTTLVIAHRLSTIRNADRILVMREGVFVEEGSHEQLLAMDGEYARLYRIQFQE